MKKMRFKNKVSFRKDERGIYAVFLIIVISILLIAVGFAIDGPRQLTANQKVKNVAEEAARYATSQIANMPAPATLAQRFEAAELLTKDFIALQNRRSLPMEMIEFRCDANTGTIVVKVQGNSRNTLSAIWLGPSRQFSAEASASLTFVASGGADANTKINICTGEFILA